MLFESLLAGPRVGAQHASLAGRPVAVGAPDLMESFVPPPGVGRLIIFADHDINFAGQLAAFTLAHRLHQGLAVEVKIPPVPESDWLDVLNGVGARER